MAGRKRKPLGPQFTQYLAPLISALKELGGSGRPSEVKEIIVRKLQLTEEQQSQRSWPAARHAGNQVDWARFYLAKGIPGSSSSKRGSGASRTRA